MLAVAREGRPSANEPILSAGAGDEGPRVYWIAYRTSRFTERQGRAADEGRLEAFEAELEEKMAACEADAEVGDCEYCISDCWTSVPNSIADATPEIRLVRVSAPEGAEPRVDGSAVLWRGRENDETELRVRTIEDMDDDGRPELALALKVHGDWPAGDGGDDEERHLVVDGDHLTVQIDLCRSFELDGHGGAVVEASAVSFQDRNGDGRKDYAVRFTRDPSMLQSCFATTPDDRPEECEPVDEAHRAHYSVEEDAWLLPEGERWPWL